MVGLDVSYDTAPFEVHSELDGTGQLSDACAQRVLATLDAHGFVVITGLLSDEEADSGLKLIRQELANPNRERSQFASETDTKHQRRDFCPLPSTPEVLSFGSLVCRRISPALLRYCGAANPILEISTLTSYFGSSHQYIHRDPPGVLCLFTALADVSEQQGGTVFVPGTHRYDPSEQNVGNSDLFMRLFQTSANMRVLRYNLSNLQRWRKSGEVSKSEFRERVWSDSADDHQPNLRRFLRGGHLIFDRTRYGVRTLLAMRRHRDEIRATHRLVQAAPKKGTVMLYMSDMLHAGPDNRDEKPRYFFNMNISRQPTISDADRAGYAAHSTLAADPKALGDLLGAGAD